MATNTKKKQRVVFTFDNRSLESLKTIAGKEQASMAEAVRRSLEIRRALQQQSENGFSEVVVRNPKTKQERVLVIPQGA
ncbi:MAG TPA: hypothetical protein VII95_20280 [Terriglobales bacterium]|jgi:hypothetical protein